MPSTADEFFQAIEEALRAGLISLTLAHPRHRSETVPRKQTVRPVVVRGQPGFQWEQQFARKQTHLNLTPFETVQRVHDLLFSTYQEGYLFTADCDLSVRKTAQGFKILRSPPTQMPVVAPAHNRRKPYLIPDGVPCPFLVALDVMTPQGQVKASRQKKFRQINRYLELVKDVAGELRPNGPVKIVDFGCGLSYLTFALHHLFQAILKRDVQLLGIDRNEQVIARCRQIAEELQLTGIAFSTADISQLPDMQKFDVAVSLHACDTATDSTLAQSVAAGAQIIFAAPCCQHELASQVTNPPLEPMLRHGIFKERFAALATDTLRVMALDAAGYRTQAVEFIELEHTPKNILLRAVRTATVRPAAAVGYGEFKKFLQLGDIAADQILQARAVADSQGTSCSEPDGQSEPQSCSSSDIGE